jgi:hypothetical protein
MVVTTLAELALFSVLFTDGMQAGFRDDDGRKLPITAGMHTIVVRGWPR